MATFSHLPSPFQPIAGIKPQSGLLTLPDLLKHSERKMIGDSAAMKRLLLQIRRIGPHFRAVLVNGECGTGKDTVARALHQESTRENGPFVAAASGNRIAYLMKVARGGTLFFKSIDDMPLQTQDELLEALRRHEWAQGGLAAPQKLSTRIVASAKQDLRGLAASGLFHQELYQRIAMVQITVPPLRVRMEDVPALTMHFLDRFTNKYQKKATIGKDAIELLKSHRWPGNVRELEIALENAVLQCERGVIQARNLAVSATRFEIDETTPSGACGREMTRLQDVVDRHVLRVLKDCAGNKLRAADLLGISRSTLYRMLDTCSPIYT